METEGHEEQEKHKEVSPKDYVRTSRFNDEIAALTAYAEIQDLLFSDTRWNLSTYRILLNQISHVLVIGARPPEEVDREIAQLLSGGQSVTLPDDVIEVLRRRRDEATKLGSWVEGHYRPARSDRSMENRRKP
jgi:hypothetical protein